MIAGNLMTRRRIALVFLILAALLTAACSPEAKKKKALEGGNKYFDTGRYKQARLMYLNAVKADPRFGEAYYKLALTNLRLGSFAEAVGNLQRTIELQPENLDAHSKLADIYLNAYAGNPEKNKGFLPEIRDLAARLEKRGKGSYEELRLRGYISLADNNPEEALTHFRAADAKKPNQQVLQLTIARTMIVLKQVEETKAYVRAMIAKDKTFGAAYDLLYGIAGMQRDEKAAEAILLERVNNNPKDSSIRLRLAAHYFVNRRTEDLERVMNETIARRSEFPNAFLDVGDFYYRIRDYDRASAIYSEGIKQEPALARTLQKRIVEVRVVQNRAAEALELCEKILKEDKNDPEAIAMRASLWLYAGKPEQINTAISELQSVVNKMPDNWILRYNLGRALMSKGDLDAARVQFSDALKYRPDYLPARLAMAQILVARGEFGAAMSAANSILAQDPTNQYARLIKSHSFMAQGKFTDSKAVLEESLKINPNQRDAKYQLGFVLFREGKFKEAEAQFQEIYSANPPDLRGLMGLTEVYTAQNQYDRALKLLDDAIQKYPKSTVLQVAWGNIGIRSGKIDAALEMFQRVLAGDPKNFDIHMRIAEGYRQKEDLPKAIEYWKKAGELMPNHISPLLYRAMALDQVNRRTEAAPLYLQILKAEPDNVVALNNYSFFLADQGSDLDLALSYAQKAKAKAPTDPMIADTLGFIYLKKNLPQNAASIFTELTGKHPQVAMFHIRLATAHFQAGDKAAARKKLDDARRNKPSKSDLDEIQKLASKLG
jgi:tetratricopeptide (TPR) repeat protein